MIIYWQWTIVKIYFSCVIYIIIFLCLGVTVAYCGPNAGTGVKGSKHDLNMFTLQGQDPQGRICVYCHVPHHAEKGTALAPPFLWAATANKSFAPYASTTFDAFIEDLTMGPTKICLSCHDGTIASDTHPNLRSDAFGGAGVGMSSDLSNDHPIGFDYLKIVQSKPDDYKSPDALWNNGNGTVTVASCLYQGKYVTCATCHDMHNIKNVADPENSYNYFIYSRQKDSSLCLSCHLK